MKKTIVRLLKAENKVELERILNTNPSPNTLNLSSTILNTQDIRILAEVLSLNTTLICLNLNWVSLKDAGVQVLSRSLQKNTSLQILSLSGSYMWNEGAKRIAEIGFND